MSEFTGVSVFNILKAKKIEYLYHANSVKTALSHIDLGGQASRQCVLSGSLPQTNQITDDLDKKFGIFDDVFFDVLDIHARVSNRNKYGPVLFRWKLELLNYLPEDAKVLITKLNPSKWKDGDLVGDRYFLNQQSLIDDFSYGNFDQMIMVRLTGGLINFNINLMDILLDDPGCADSRPSGIHSVASNEISSRLNKYKINIPVISRDCRANCSCLREYASINTRIPYFFNA